MILCIKRYFYIFSFQKFSEKYFFWKRIDNIFSNSTSKWSSTELFIISERGYFLDKCIMPENRYSFLEEFFLHWSEKEFYDKLGIFFCEWIIEDDIIYAVQEFYTEILLEFFSERNIIRTLFSYQIWGHDNDRISHIYPSSFSISHEPFIENLEKYIPDIPMCFFDFIEKNHRIRMTTDSLGKLTPLFISHISWRCSDKTRDRVRLHIFTHIETNICIWIIPENTSKSLCGFSFPNPCRTKEEKRSNRFSTIRESCLWPTKSLGNFFECMMLSDNIFPELIFEIRIETGFWLEKLSDWYTRPFSYNTCNIRTTNRIIESDVFFENLKLFLFFRNFSISDFRDTRILSCLSEVFCFSFEDKNLISKWTDFFSFSACMFPYIWEIFEIFLFFLEFLSEFIETNLLFFFIFYCFSLDFEWADFFFEFIKCNWTRKSSHLDTRGCFIEKIDSLIWEFPFSDVPDRKIYSRYNRIIGYLNTMKSFISFLESPEYCESIVSRWFLDRNWLKSAFKCAIFFDIFSILSERRCTDNFDSPTSEGWLEEISSITRTLCSSCSDYSMEFIYEKYDFSFWFFYFIYQSFESFFKLPTVTRSCDESSEVECTDLSVLEYLRNLPRYYLSGDSFDDSRLAHSWITYKNWIILRSARENLDSPVYLILSTDNWIDFSFPRERSQIDSIFLERSSVVCFLELCLHSFIWLQNKLALILYKC